MGCSSSKAVKVVPEKEDQQVPILAPLSEPIHTSLLEKLDNSQGTLSEENEMPKQKDVFKKKTLPAIQSTPKSVAFDIILDDSGAQSSQKGRLILPKIEVKSHQPSPKQKQIMDHILAGAEMKYSGPLRLNSASGYTRSSPEELRRRLQEKESQAAQNRLRGREEMQQKLAEREEHARLVQSRRGQYIEDEEED